MRYKHLIPENPTLDDFKESWYKLFECPFEHCKIENVEFGSLNVRTPYQVFLMGGFFEVTEYPLLKNSKDLWYECGKSWGIDENENFYYKLDKETLKPNNFDSVKARIIIVRFLKQYYAN